jgi:hypothetical protein
MSAPPSTVLSLAALFDAQPTVPQLSLHEAASRPYIIDATSPAPALVCAQLALAAHHRHPTSILICDDVGKLRIISLIFKKQQGFGLPLDAAVDEKFFGWDSELIMGQGTLVEVLPTTFNQTTTDVLVPTLTRILAAMAGNNDPNLKLGPLTAGDPETELLRTRNTVLVPSDYAGLILACGDGISQRAFFDDIYPLMQTDGNEVACLVLTNFVRMTMTLSAGPNNNPTVGIHRPLPAPWNVSP